MYGRVSEATRICNKALRAADLARVLRKGVGWSGRWAAVISLAAPIAPLSTAVLHCLYLPVGALCCSGSICQ